jgi:hypothetical protein
MGDGHDGGEHHCRELSSVQRCDPVEIVGGGEGREVNARVGVLE